MQRLRDTCIVPGCGREHHARDFCATHYAQFKRGFEPSGPINARVMQKPPECSEYGCAEPVKAKGLCKMHYQRLLRHGHTRYRDRKKPAKACAIPECDNTLYAKGLCHAHYAKQFRWKSWGIDADRYQEMLKEQGGLCAICESPERERDKASGKIKDLAIDHCHATGEVRALLCSNCNRALGLFNDDPAMLAKARSYVLRYAASGITPARQTGPADDAQTDERLVHKD
jgi:hypothetical protein